MINTHHHLYQVLQRCLPSVQDAKLFDWLVTLYEVWRELTPAAVRASARAGLAELLLTGCTTSTDHFYLFPKRAPQTLLDDLVEAASEVGIRFHPCRGSMSRGRSKGGLPPDDVVQDEDDILKSCQQAIEKFHDPKPGAMVRLALAPCSPFSVTDDLLRETLSLARSTGVRLHTHLAETLDEEQFCLETHGVRPLGYMERVGWLGEDVWFAHCVYLDEKEIQQMAETKTGVAHCPSSNLRLGSGIAPIPSMVAEGVPVGIAVDGSASNDASDMLGEVRQAMMVHRVGTAVDAMSARTAFKLATRGGAQVLGREDVGSIELGKAADLVIFDVGSLGYAGAAAHDPLAALLLCGFDHRADTVIVGGKVLVEGKRLIHLDERMLVEDANREAVAMREAASTRTGRDFLVRS